MANEMYLKTFHVSSSKDFKTLSSVSGKEGIPRSRLTESSNTSVTRSLNTSNNRFVSSPHPDSDSRLVNLLEISFAFISKGNILTD